MRSYSSICILLGAIVVAAEAVRGITSSKALSASNPVRASALQDLRHVFCSGLVFFTGLIHERFQRIVQGQVHHLDMVQLLAACSIIHGIRLWRRQLRERSEIRDSNSVDQKLTRGWGFSAGSESGISSAISSAGGHQRTTAHKMPAIDADLADPGLLKKHSTFKSFTTSIATYPSIRTFYRPHSQADKLPSEPTPLPLLVFVHGLGGSLAQFSSLLTSLVNVGPCLGVDLPGCGRSAFSPTTWNAYTPKALAELLCVVIAEHCERDIGQGVILIGHSAGCSYSALVAQTHGDFDVLALVGICPQATPPSEKQIATYEKVLRIPTPIFDIWRAWDRRGGPGSDSVTRIVGKNADIEVKQLQERFNKQSRTPVWRRMAWGLLPSRNMSEQPEKGLPGLDVWTSLRVPLFLVGGEGDGITTIDQITAIGQALGKVEASTTNQPVSQIHGKNGEANINANDLSLDEKRHSTASRTELTVIEDDLQAQTETSAYSKSRRVLKTSILPAPASHALLYDRATYRILAGLIQDFMSEHVDTRLSLGWQLQHLSTGGKWDVKNLEKWQVVEPVSEPIAGIFHAMKTLREIDDTHCPEIFVNNWKERIKAVIDISYESPVYDPKHLEEGGIEYHKFPTVSKIPPTPEEAKDFIELVDRLRSPASTGGQDEPLLAVHCHYGFNRTGFFICCYLIEKEGHGVQQAIDAFAAARPRGIKHAHFLDQLFVRYCVGLERVPTL